MKDFAFEDMPLSRFEWVVGISLAYLVLAVLAKQREKTDFLLPSSLRTGIFVIHNLLMSFGSLVMFLGLFMASYHRGKASGFHFLLCEPKTDESSSFFFWLYLYYLSKYYELFDTALAFLCRGKGPRHYFMHVYHHFYVLYMAYFYIKQRQSLATVGVLFNTFVHIFMYYYYARAALAWETPWKNYITRLQIVQFLTSFLCFFAALKAQNFSWNTLATHCSGTTALAANVIFNFTLLLLFFNVLSSNKKGRGNKKGIARHHQTTATTTKKE